MNPKRQNRLQPALLATLAALVALVVVLWLVPSLRISLANGHILDGATKSVSSPFAQPGDIVTYTIVLNNSSPVSDALTIVTDPLHPSLTYVPGSAATIPPGSGTVTDTNGITWTVTVSPSAAITLTYRAEIDTGATDGTLITNTATISSGGSAIQRQAVVAIDLPPTAQIWSPERDAIITDPDALTLSGYAWDHAATPPFLTGDPLLTTQRQDERSYYLAWTAVVSAENYVIHEATSPSFDLYETFSVAAPTTNLLITKGSDEDGTYYYRVRATRFGLSPSRWSNVESVVVPWTTGMAAPSAALAPSAVVTVEVRVDDGAWQTATITPTSWGGWSWTYEWSPLPSEQSTLHALHTRATDNAGNVSAIDTITITLDNQRYTIYLPLMALRWPPVPGSPVLNAISDADNDASYIVSWSYDPGTPPISADNYTLQEDDNADFTSPTEYDGLSNPSYQFTGKDPGVYYYRVRGNNSYGAGAWSNVESITVTPGTPTLNAIDNPDQSPSYTVSWSAARDAQSYVLEEDTSSTFDSPTVVYTGSSTAYQVSGRTSGTYYYRVKAVYDSISSPWSNVVSIVVQAGFFDNFSSTSTGWPQTTYKRGTSPDGDVMKVAYKDGTYQMKILLDTVGLNNKRMGVVASPFVNPYGNYDVSVDHYFAQAADQTVEPTWGKAGLVFAAKNDYSVIYVVEWHFPQSGQTPQCAVYKYSAFQLPTTIVWLAGGTPLREWDACNDLKSGYNKVNNIRVEVRGTQATVYINGNKLGTYSSGDFAAYHLVGLMTGSWERTPVESRFDNFGVTPK